MTRAREIPSPLIVAGDLNAGPGVSEVNFNQILNAGFASVHDLIQPRTEDVTWHPANPLNANGPHKGCPPQRIDHVFVRATDLTQKKLLPISSRICLQEPVITVKGRQNLTVSDHFALLVEVDLIPEPRPVMPVGLSDPGYRAP